MWARLSIKTSNLAHFDIHLNFQMFQEQPIWITKKSEVFTWRCLCFFIPNENHSDSNQCVNLAAAEDLAALFL